MINAGYMRLMSAQPIWLATVFVALCFILTATKLEAKEESAQPLLKATMREMGDSLKLVNAAIMKNGDLSAKTIETIERLEYLSARAAKIRPTSVQPQPRAELYDEYMAKTQAGIAKLKAAVVAQDLSLARQVLRQDIVAVVREAHSHFREDKE